MHRPSCHGCWGARPATSPVSWALRTNARSSIETTSSCSERPAWGARGARRAQPARWRGEAGPAGSGSANLLDRELHAGVGDLRLALDDLELPAARLMGALEEVEHARDRATEGDGGIRRVEQVRGEQRGRDVARPVGLER